MSEKAHIENMLVLSTGHTPPTMTAEMPDFGALRNTDHEYGWIVFVASVDLEDLGEIPIWIRPIWALARERDCSIILFDRDADRIPYFKLYDW